MFHSIVSFDHTALVYIFAQRDPAILTFFLDVTQLGSVIAVFLVGGALALILALHQRIAEVIGLTFALLGTAVASTFLKNIFARPRPDLAYQAYTETGYSMPSQHAALATALSLYVVYLVYRLSPSRAVRTTVFCLALIVIAAVGFSRLYLGVHYVSDVVAGTILGALIAGIGIMIERSLERFNLNQ
ncbi:phosphatase PAP2 family protein [Candidatus Kaiserbacteria bacterium]|nr:phosphatase PAP2 family protein [Candidatus Kaiserbacteria bacterium]